MNSWNWRPCRKSFPLLAACRHRNSSRRNSWRKSTTPYWPKKAAKPCSTARPKGTTPCANRLQSAWNRLSWSTAILTISLLRLGPSRACPCWPRSSLTRATSSSSKARPTSAPSMPLSSANRNSLKCRRTKRALSRKNWKRFWKNTATASAWCTSSRNSRTRRASPGP